MRVWIGPWEDTRGDLHAPGYVYTEIEPRRWQIGAPAPTTPAVLTPLQIEPREAPPKEAPSPRPDRPRGARGERGLAAPNGR
jgi:conjugal transfer pilus assembly protein TraV